MTDIILKLRVVTPLFISGANQEQAAELRAPSIKGLLRFWYRVIYPDDPIGEARIFGGQGKKQGQSGILLRIVERNLHFGAKGDNHWNKTKTAYLGYGVIVRDKEKKEELTTRTYIKSGSRFSLSVRFNRLLGCVLSDEDKIRVKRALWAWLMFGGLGSRARNGLGSLAVENTTGMNDLPSLMVKNKDELRASILKFIEDIQLPKNNGLSSYTQWSKQTQCLILEHGKSAEEALENLGRKIHSLRSYQSQGRLSCVKQDHDLMDRFIHNKIPSASPPLRSAFGLPHNYFFSSSQKSAEVNFMDKKAKKGRRASPVFFTVYEFSTRNQACAVALYLPAKLIPKDKTVRISTGEENSSNYRYRDVALPDDFSAVTALLDKLSEDGFRVYP